MQPPFSILPYTYVRVLLTGSVIGELVQHGRHYAADTRRHEESGPGVRAALHSRFASRPAA